MEILSKGLLGQEIGMTYDDDVLDWIVEQGTDADFGARPLKRFIQRYVETVVAKEVISGNLERGEVLTLAMNDGELIVNKS